MIVNRVWQYHFGNGIVQNSSDFGRLGIPPTHPELLDWLASEFLSSGRNLKRLHRIIVLSTVYQQASRNPSFTESGQSVDPENRWLWRFPSRRLDAEQIRDAMLVSAGNLDASQGGPSTDHDGLRRSIYTRIKRNKPHAMLVTFDAPDGNASVAKRSVTTTPIQSLLLTNYDWPLATALAMARDVATSNRELREQVREIYMRCVQREPDEIELKRAESFIAYVEQLPTAAVDTDKKSATAGTIENDVSPRLRGLRDLCHVLFNTSEFLYVD